jgi:lipoprotein-anchoring transpeptidase ErfK/SrfK
MMIDNKIPQLQNRLQQLHQNTDNIYLHVDIKKQKLFFIKNKEVIKVYPVSTSKFGTGNLENSNKTPLGVHQIINKIGHNVPPGRIFRSREDTGEDYNTDMTEENLILTRILRLDGLEPGINKGDTIDSYARYIYIHGTNREDLIGTPMSHGCICMRNNDIIELFDTVEEGTLVIID